MVCFKLPLQVYSLVFIVARFDSFRRFGLLSWFCLVLASVSRFFPVAPQVRRFFWSCRFRVAQIASLPSLAFSGGASYPLLWRSVLLGWRPVRAWAFVAFWPGCFCPCRSCQLWRFCFLGLGCLPVVPQIFKLPMFGSGGKVQPSLGLAVCRTSGQTGLFCWGVAGLWRVLPGLTSRSKGRAARWRF